MGSESAWRGRPPTGDGKNIRYVENMPSDTSGPGYNLVFNLWNSVTSSAGSLTGGGNITTSRGARTTKLTGSITIQNAVDIVVGKLDASLYPGYGGGAGAITVTQTGTFSATSTLTFTSQGTSLQTYIVIF